MTFTESEGRNGDKLLFTPGPLTTSASVKAAMSRDLGSRDGEFMAVIQNIRAELLRIAGQAEDSIYSAIPIQGSGTYGIEATLSSIVPPDGRLLIIINGAYGKRITQIAAVHKIAFTTLVYPENRTPDLDAIEAALQAEPSITHVAVVHCETTTGILNPIREIGEIVAHNERIFFVDAMSSFGGVPLDMAAASIDYLVSSSNKCIEGVPGFSFVLARKTALSATEGYARTVSLDLFAQWRALESGGQFRFTPPTHTMLAFNQALAELAAEGGVSGRAMRYQANHEALVEGMRALGFREFLTPEQQSDIITTYYYPNDPNFDFERFYRGLSARGYVIYPGKLADLPCFRIGSIGRVFPSDMVGLLAAITDVLRELGIVIPAGLASTENRP